MRVVISAGGTGGHIYPAIAIINKINKFKNNLLLLIIIKEKFNKKYRKIIMLKKVI
jgi:UDP-N-acetylglucosamine--N-acetylmuramyl-(pentapeptide) pyrophosphoryl-undecaprenol N-acetylglucosamine transferase